MAINTRNTLWHLLQVINTGAETVPCVFNFEQLSIIPLVFLLLTFNKYTALAVLSFFLSIHGFYVSKHNYSEFHSQSEHSFAAENLKRHKQKMNTGRKTIEEKQTILLETMQLLRKVFLYFICKYFIMWDVQSHSITGRSRNDLKSGYFS